MHARVEAAVSDIKAARAEGDEGLGLYKEIYNHLVAYQRELGALRSAALGAQLGGRLPLSFSCWPGWRATLTRP